MNDSLDKKKAYVILIKFVTDSSLVPSCLKIKLGLPKCMDFKREKAMLMRKHRHGIFSIILHEKADVGLLFLFCTNKRHLQNTCTPLKASSQKRIQTSVILSEVVFVFSIFFCILGRHAN